MHRLLVCPSFAPKRLDHNHPVRLGSEFGSHHVEVLYVAFSDLLVPGQDISGELPRILRLESQVEEGMMR